MTIKRQINKVGDTTIERLLLIADEGKELTNDGGETRHNCIAVSSAGGWEEVDALIIDEEISDTEALNIITGGATT